MSRLDSLARLALAYGRHQIRRLGRRRRPVIEAFLRAYARDHLVPLTDTEREALPAISTCIGCGLCDVAAGGRAGAVALSDLAAHLRPLPLLPALKGALGDVDAEAGALACPMGVPVTTALAMLERLSAASEA